MFCILYYALRFVWSQTPPISVGKKVNRCSKRVSRPASPLFSSIFLFVVADDNDTDWRLIPLELKTFPAFKWVRDRWKQAPSPSVAFSLGHSDCVLCYFSLVSGSPHNCGMLAKHAGVVFLISFIFPVKSSWSHVNTNTLDRAWPVRFNPKHGFWITFPCL